MKDYNKWLDDSALIPRTPEPESYCGVYWIITTCLTAIAIGAAFGVACWLLVLA